MSVWLYGETAGGASDIIEKLPWEQVGDKVSVREAPNEYSHAISGASQIKNEDLNLRLALARESGLSMLLIGVYTGADEKDFETVDPP